MSIGAALGREVKALWGEERGATLIAISIGWGLLIGTRMIYPIILPSLQTSFDLSLTAAGLLITVLWLFYALGQLPAGALTDKFDERAILVASTITVGVTVGVVVAAPTTIVLFTATALCGLGMSLFHIPRVTLLTELYRDRLGRALGLTLAVGDLGQTVIPPIAGILTIIVAWQVGLGFVAPLIILTGISIWMLLPAPDAAETPVEVSSSPGVKGILVELRQPAVLFITGVMFLYFFIWQSFTAFYPTYLVSEKGLSPTVAGVMFGFFFAVGIVVKPMAGAAYDRFGLQATLISLLVAPAVGFVLLPILDSIWVLFVTTALISTSLGTGTITQSWLSESFSEEMRGTGLGMIMAPTIALAAGGPVIFGTIADYGYFDEGYVALAAIMAGCILVALRMPRV